MALSLKATYENALRDMGHGFPLFSPGKVDLGDVGFIDSDGLFRTFYNVETPPDSEGGPKNVPLERYEESDFVLGPMHVYRDSSTGATISVSPQSVPTADNTVKLEFGRVGQNAVVLIPWPQVKKESLKHVGELEEYFQNHKSWLEGLCKREGIEWDELILVHGTLKTRHWANAINLIQQSTAELSFTVGGQGTRVWGKWLGSATSVKTSPTPANSDDVFNETIFIHRVYPKGFRGVPKGSGIVKRRLGPTLYRGIEKQLSGKRKKRKKGDKA